MLFVINNRYLSRIWWGTSRWDGGDGHWLPPWINLWPGENWAALHRKIWMNGLHWRRCKTCPWRETLWGMVTCPSHRKTTIRWNIFHIGTFFNLCETALTFLISGCGLVWHGPLDYAPVSKTSNVGLGKALFISYLSNQWKGLRLNFSPEKSSSEPFLYRFSLQLLSWYMNVPNLWTDSLVEFPWNCLNFFGILQVEYSVICC